MTLAQVNNTIVQHYMTVNALTPYETNTVDSAAEAAISELPLSLSSAPIIVFLAILIIGLFILFLSKAREIKHIFTVAFIALLSGAIPLTLQMLGKQTQIQTRAGPENAPKTVIVKDVKATEFTVEWHTDRKVLGTIRVGIDPEGRKFTLSYPEKDLVPKTDHFVVATHLKPNTDYYFEILSFKEWYNDNGRPLHVKTLPQ